MGVGQPASHLLWTSVSPSVGSLPAGCCTSFCAPELPHLPFCWSLIPAHSTCSPVASLALQGSSEPLWAQHELLRTGAQQLSPSFSLRPYLPLSSPPPFTCCFCMPPIQRSPPHFPLCPSSPRPVGVPGGCALARVLARLDFHQDGLLRELRGGDVVLEVFWA